MCWQCFKEYTDAPVVNERVQAAYDLIVATSAGAVAYGFDDPGDWTLRPTKGSSPVVMYDLRTMNLPCPEANDPHFSTLLHVIVADMNVDDCFFDIDDEEDSYRDRYDAAEQWERDIFDSLAALSEAERATAIAMEWGYIARDGTLRPDLTDTTTARAEALAVSHK